VPPAAAPTPIPASAPLLGPDPLLSGSGDEDWVEGIVGVGESPLEDVDGEDVDGEDVDGEDVDGGAPCSATWITGPRVLVQNSWLFPLSVQLYVLQYGFAVAELY
jgi:hypothetical protein